MKSSKPIIRRAGQVAALIALAAAPVLAQGRTPAQIIERYAKAVDPENKLATIEGLKTTIQMDMPGTGMSATITGMRRRPNQILTTMTIPGMGEIKTGYDGTVAWANDPMQGPRLMNAEELKAMSDEADFRRMSRDVSLYTTMEPAGEATVEGEAADCLKLTATSGRVSTECFSRATGLLLEVRTTQPTVQGNVEVVAQMKDYKKVGPGLLMAHKIVNNMMGMQQTITITEVVVGPMDAKLFALPPEIAALKKP